MRILKLAAILTVLSTLPAAWADGEGSARIEPGPEAAAGTWGTWTITYQPGPEGLAPAGGLRLQFSGYPIRLFTTPQCDDPKAPGYTTARSTAEQVPVKTRFERELRHGWQQVEQVVVTVGEPGLPADAALVVVYGDRSGGGPGGYTRGAEGDDLPVRIESDTDGDGTYASLAEFPRLTLVGGSAAALALYGPSQAVVGEPTRFVLSARDGRNAVATRGLPAATVSSPALEAPVAVTFEKDRRAVAAVELVFRQTGVQRVVATPGSVSAEATAILADQFLKATRSEAAEEAGFLPELTRVEITATQMRPGSTLRIRSYWRNSGTTAARGEYRVFCHLERRPAAGKALANWDHTPPRPTTKWEPGQEVVCERVGGLPGDVPRGEHVLTMGLYRTLGPGQFLNLVGYEVARLQVGPDLPLVSGLTAARSNPIEVLARPPARRLLWGDLHCHTENSGDGSGSVDALYRYARDTARLDFCASSDHVGPRYPAAQWRLLQEAAKRHNEPGRFVSILGYEWSNVFHGDKNVYFANDFEPIRVPTSAKAEDLYAMLADVDCVAIPHHPAYPVGLRGTDWGRIDPRLMPVVEMCSGHGAGEYLGNPRPYGRNKPMGPSLPGGFAQDALNRGLRLGFICSSDDHSAHAGRIGYLAAVYAESFDRHGILEALRARNCYGTTGARILVDFAADGQPMGSVVETPEPPLLTAQVHGTTTLERVEIVRDGKVCHAVEPEGESCTVRYTPDALDREESYFYLRVTQSDGEMAWSSPVFVRNTGPWPRLAASALTISPAPTAGRECTVSAQVRNIGTAASAPGVVRFTLDGPPARPVTPERPPARAGIGGLMAQAGLQVWRWPVDETSVNVFVRWGGDDQARDCDGQLRILDAVEYYATPFHFENDDELEDDGEGRLRWRTNAEAGSGDGLNLWVRIDSRKATRIELDARRGGRRRPAEIAVRAGPVGRLPFELPLVDYDPDRWIGEALFPALEPGGSCTVKVRWTPRSRRQGRLLCEAETKDGRARTAGPSPAPTIEVR